MHSILKTLISSGGGLLCVGRLCGVWEAFWSRNKRWIRAVLLCGASLKGIHCCYRLACPCGVFL